MTHVNLYVSCLLIFHKASSTLRKKETIERDWKKKKWQPTHNNPGALRWDICSAKGTLYLFFFLLLFCARSINLYLLCRLHVVAWADQCVRQNHSNVAEQTHNEKCPHISLVSHSWEQKSLSDLHIIQQVNWRKTKCIVHLNWAVKTR